MASRSLTLVLASALLLASCGTQPAAPSAPAAASPAYVLTVTHTRLSPAELEAKYGGRVLTHTPTFALLGLSRAPAGGLRAQDASGEVAVAEANRNVFRVPEVSARASINLWGDASINLWGDASINLWGDASINLWGDASINLWGDGGYTVLPENTDAWRQIRLDAAQQSGTRLGQDVTVAVIDTGVDLAHPAFVNTLTPASSWRDFVDDDDSPQDQGTLGTGLVGHGTEAAGLALQVAPRARIMPLRVLNEGGTGDVADVAAAIVWAVDHGANVINLSLGASETVEAVSQAIAYANAQGVAVVAAAGNNGQAGLDYPAADFAANDALNVSVGSVDAGDLKSSFSQYAAGLTLLTPGEALTGPAPGGKKAAWSGTSMSTAVASGALALGLGERAGAALAVTNLKATAYGVDGLSGNAAYAGQLGRGRIDLGAFVQRQKTP